jgi:hypothetical protein
VDYSHIEGWTPVAYHAEREPALLWADLRGYAPDNRLYTQILQGFQKPENVPLIGTGLSALAAPGRGLSVDPRVIIVHASRCGSTLLARLAASVDDAPLLLEPQLLFQLLSHDLHGRLDRPVEQVLRAAVGALSPETGRPCVIKLYSQATRFLPKLRSAFPKTPVIWLQRRPAEIVESNISNPPGPLRALSDADKASLAIERAARDFMAAKAFVDDGVHVFDYQDLPDKAWARIAAIMGFDPIKNLDRMQDVMQRDAKTGKPYVARSRQILSDDIQKFVRGTLDPLYDALALRRPD